MTSTQSTTTSLRRQRNHNWLHRLPVPIRTLIGSPLTTLALMTLLGYLVVTSTPAPGSEKLALRNTHKESLYQGKQYWKEGVTLDTKTLYETSFARFQVHKVKMGEKKSVIDDWLWYDESDNVNVLVSDKDGNFLVLEQTKYAIAGTTLAVVGGLVEKGEDPLHTAIRELQEELGMISSHWVPLNSYTAAANRGGGTTHVFWAQKAEHTIQNKNQVVVGQADLERQDLLKLSREELIESVLSGRFKEIKWTATVALALLKSSKDHCKGG